MTELERKLLDTLRAIAGYDPPEGYRDEWTEAAALHAVQNMAAEALAEAEPSNG